MNRTKTIRRLILSVAVSLAIGAVFFYFTPPQVIASDLKQVAIQWVYLPLFFLAVLGNLYLRGQTLALLINSPEHVTTSRWMTISSGHNLSTSLSGIILGDAVLFWLLNRFDIHWQKSLFTVLIARVFELPALFLFLFLGLFGTGKLFPTQELWVFLSGLAFAVSFTLLFCADWLIARLPQRLWFGQGGKIAQFGQAYRELKGRCMTQLLLLSLGKIVLAFFFYIFAMRLFSVDLTVWEECFAFGIFTFATVIPVQGIMGLGTFEAYFSIGLILLGISSGTALVLGFLVHMLFLASFLLVALYFLWFVLLRARTTIE